MSQGKFRFLFVSSCTDYWGGSEELWFGAALNLFKDSHTTRVLKTNVDWNTRQIKTLESVSCLVQDLFALTSKLRRVINRFLPAKHQYTAKQRAQKLLDKNLKGFSPDLTIISQGMNYDGIYLAEICQKRGLPYVLIAQKAVDFLFPPNNERDKTRNVYLSAEKSYFVAQNNLKLTQEQIGAELPNAEVVFNPFSASYENSLPINKSSKIQFACVGRLFLIDKGQDILLRVLAQEKWRKRDVEVTFFGEGVDKKAIEEMADLLEVENIKFAGHVRYTEEIWRDSHALILASRSEGLPLVLVEAMLYGRPAIVTNVGGAAEVLDDGVTGFIAASATVEALDEAMERAWAQKHNWHEIGRRAAESIRKIVPPNPCAIFAEKLVQVAEKSA